MEHSTRLRIKNGYSDLEYLNAELDGIFQKCGIAQETAFSVRLAVEEIITNQIKYAFTESERHDIDFEIAAGKETIRLVFSDSGRPFDPLSAPEPNLSSALAERPIGGLGLHLVKNLCASINYERLNNRNVLTVYFKSAKENTK